ncbi:response regulator transcription factor [Flavicella sediminum]|uniref:response regulator transcription factor n=1 Tax=Flavicella sediminum TaxID=2585141 RepID=UPI001123CB0E|nr:response regulator transcription factor [Flavicella sediminum]
MSNPIKIILAEDELSLGEILTDSLESRDFDVLWCKNGQEVLEAYEKDKPELLVLDVMMPILDGFSVAKKIRETDADTPIIFLTAKSQTSDVVEGFDLGGNDYLKKPFSMEELIVRIHALLRRNGRQESLQIGHYFFEFKKQILKHNSKEFSLTHREAHLLFHLYQNKNDVLDRSFILKKLWGNDDFFNARSMDVFISKLRKKLILDSNIKIINVRGYGYKLIC